MKIRESIYECPTGKSSLLKIRKLNRFVEVVPSDSYAVDSNGLLCRRCLVDTGEKIETQYIYTTISCGYDEIEVAKTWRDRFTPPSMRKG